MCKMALLAGQIVKARGGYGPPEMMCWGIAVGGRILAALGVCREDRYYDWSLKKMTQGLRNMVAAGWIRENDTMRWEEVAQLLLLEIELRAPQGVSDD
jgi:hypothetical protein